MTEPSPSNKGAVEKDGINSNKMRLVDENSLVQTNTSSSPRRRSRIRTRLNTAWGKIELNLGGLIPFPPSFWRFLKVFICHPILLLALYLQADTQVKSLDLHRFETPSKIAFWAFFIALFLDFLRQSKATFIDSQILISNQQVTNNNQSVDNTALDSKHRLTSQLNLISDFPVSCLATFALFKIHPELLNSQPTLSYVVIARLALDLITLIFIYKGRGPKRTRLRTLMNGVSLYVILGLNLGFTPNLITPDNATILLSLHTIFLSLVFAFQVRVLQKRFIADTLSGLNFICGLVSIHYSLQGRFETSLLFLLLGAAFDGFDGAAARKFGGTKFGVYSDDIADGMNYGIAPAFAVYALMQGIEGLIIGTFYAVFTLSRLVYFTLNKDEGDPGYFAGVPSPVGGMIVMSSVVLFTQQALWVSFLVGVSSTLMVSFKTPYVHVFRAFSWRSMERKRQAVIGGPLFLIAFLFVTSIWGTKGAAAVILGGACLYGFIPSILSFYFVLCPPKESITESSD